MLVCKYNINLSIEQLIFLVKYSTKKEIKKQKLLESHPNN